MLNNLSGMSVNEVMCHYRNLQLLNTEFNSIYSWTTLLLFNYLTISIIIFINVICIHFYSEMTWCSLILLTSGSLAIVSAIKFAFPIAANVYSNSIELIRLAKNECQVKQDLVGKKIVKSFFPLKICIGNFLVIKKFITCRKLGFILIWTLKLLIVLRK